MLHSELKKMAVEDLSRYYLLKHSLDILPKEIHLLRSSALYSSASAGTYIMSSASADAKMIKHITRLEQLEHQLKNTAQKVAAIEAALDAITPAQKEILYSYYINRQRRSVTHLAIDTHTDRSALYRRAVRALDRYILAYFGTLGD